MGKGVASDSLAGLDCFLDPTVNGWDTQDMPPLQWEALCQSAPPSVVCSFVKFSTESPPDFFFSPRQRVVLAARLRRGVADPCNDYWISGYII